MAENSSTMHTRRVGRRDWRVIALTEIGLVSVMSAGFFILLWIVWNEFTAAPPLTIIDLITGFGVGAHDALMGALGVVATVQLACFIAIVTGQIVHQDGIEESRLRSMLSAISLVAVTAVAPAVLATSFYSVTSFDVSGLLLVALPIYLLQLAISTVIGTFEVGDDETLRRLAMEQVTRAQEQISRLEGRPSASPWHAALVVLVVLVVLLVTALATTGIAAAMSGTLEIPKFSGAPTALIAFGSGISLWIFGLVTANCQLKLSGRTVDVVSVIVLLLIVIAFYLLTLLLAVLTYWPFAVAMTVLLLVLLPLTIASVVEAGRVRKGDHVRRRPSPIIGIVGLVGTHEALNSARKTKASAQRRAHKYSMRIAEYEARNPSKRASEVPTPGEVTASDLSPRHRSRIRRALAELLL